MLQFAKFSQKRTKMLINAVIEKDENGYFAFVPELKGCVSEGASFEEARTNIKEAIELYLESLGADEIRHIVAKEAMITPIEVALGR
ncbi:toxin-antitoxin system, antitoxin component, HicB family [Helicobacter cinaedi CCUG 18818 = ATCC BAA-847]|uniref:Toxin-antitoxin system, antitoxin component, HicB family n=2 Tax=Helicobacter cinaedi CCUG 18818 = ATCC BAA-847 TaxID=537971 RepID=A0ABN0BAC1_9HELI|nr:toxin-antitoxin system, antitoxin component, HicB family [Helicobacter cinaedi CCUG 18818 = ATCC BAA-847]